MSSLPSTIKDKQVPAGMTIGGVSTALIAAVNSFFPDTDVTLISTVIPLFVGGLVGFGDYLWLLCGVPTKAQLTSDGMLRRKAKICKKQIKENKKLNICTKVLEQKLEEINLARLNINEVKDVSLNTVKSI